MFSGKYLNEGHNIGHEIINLLKDDQDRNYIYIIPNGKMAQEHDNQINAILLVRLIREGILEVLAKAEELEQIVYDNSNESELHEKQIQYVRDNNITYGGVPLDKILEGNTYKGKADAKSRYVTFIVGRLNKVKVPIYLTEEKGYADEKEHIYYVDLGNSRFGNRNMPRYISKIRDENAYNILKMIIGNSELWESSNTTEKITKDFHPNCLIHSFISIIGKQYDELVYSNMFAHFFVANKDRFRKFSQEVFNIPLGDFSIKREYEKIDILIEDERNLIIIENKIKSRINGIKYDIYGNEIQTQLEKYYEVLSKQKEGKTISCFIFAPKYNRIDESRICNKYRLIEYDKLYDFFSKEEYCSDSEKYYDDFLKALYIHSRPVDNLNYEIMVNRFTKRINEIKEQLKEGEKSS